MSKPAARLGDPTVHGGSIVAGEPTVLIGGMPAARANDMHVCPMVNPGTPPPPHVGGPVLIGSPTVLIAGMMAARAGDMAQCQGPPDSIAMGCPTVLIGEKAGGGGGAAGGGSATSGSTGVEALAEKKGAAASSAAGAAKASAAGTGDSQPGEEGEDHFLDVKFVDKGGLPIQGMRYKATAPDSRESKGSLAGQIKKTGIKPGSYQIELRQILKAGWSVAQAREGDEIKLQVEGLGFEDGSPALFKIYRRDINAPDRKVAEITGKIIQGDKVEADWTYSHPDDVELTDPATSGKYSAPQFLFTVKIDGETKKSGLLDYRDWLEIEVKDEGGKGLADEEYILHLPNGEIRRGNLDGSGLAREEDLPPGPCSWSLPDRENLVPLEEYDEEE